MHNTLLRCDTKVQMHTHTETPLHTPLITTYPLHFYSTNSMKAIERKLLCFHSKPKIRSNSEAGSGHKQSLLLLQLGVVVCVFFFADKSSLLHLGIYWKSYICSTSTCLLKHMGWLQYGLWLLPCWPGNWEVYTYHTYVFCMRLLWSSSSSSLAAEKGASFA